MLDKHSRPSQLPLVIAGLLPQHQALFRRITHNPFVVSDGIDVSVDALSNEALTEGAWDVFRPRYLAQLAQLVGECEDARARGLGSDEVPIIAAAAAAGRVSVLLIDADRHVPGRLDRSVGTIELAALEQPDVDDLLDDLGELVLRQHGRVVTRSPQSGRNR